MSDAFSVDDQQYMSRAIELAKQGRYTTDPNPRVGCVLVKDGQIVGEGFHRKAGELHAERHAIANAGDAAQGATAYVTLEPCCHHGRTPPCTQGLIEAGVDRVVVAMQDPNPLVAGKGKKQLIDAGILVQSGLLKEEARALNPGFIKRMSLGRPYVRCKLAMSLDGRTAMASGESKWITGEAARADVQLLRAGSSAIVTGIGTVLTDNPSMNVRLEASDLPGVDEVRQPLRVVLDAKARMPPKSHMLRLPGETLVCVSEHASSVSTEALQQAGAETVLLSSDAKGRISLPALMTLLAERQINEVLLECGATLAGAALLEEVVDELIVYIAPHLMGDAARGLVKLPGVTLMADRINLELKEVKQIGQDLRLTYQVS